MKMHKEGKGSKYVYSRLPFEIIHTEKFPDRSTASKRESYIKSLDRAEKMKIIVP